MFVLHIKLSLEEKANITKFLYIKITLLRDIAQRQSHSNTYYVLVSDVAGKESIQNLLESTEPTETNYELIPEDGFNQVAGTYDTDPNQIKGEGRQAHS